MKRAGKVFFFARSPLAPSTTTVKARFSETSYLISSLADAERLLFEGLRLKDPGIVLFACTLLSVGDPSEPRQQQSWKWYAMQTCSVVVTSRNAPADRNFGSCNRLWTACGLIKITRGLPGSEDRKQRAFPSAQLPKWYRPLSFPLSLKSRAPDIAEKI